MTSILIVAAAVLVSYFAAGGSTVIVDSSAPSPRPSTRPLRHRHRGRGACSPPLGITPGHRRLRPCGRQRRRHRGDERPAGERPGADRRPGLPGNTTAATGKGFAIGSASLTALALLVSYVSIVQEKTPEALDLSLTNPLMLVGLFIGACSPSSSPPTP